MPQITLDPVKLPGRSMGLKLIVVCFLALVMSIPALFVWALTGEPSALRKSPPKSRTWWEGRRCFSARF